MENSLRFSIEDHRLSYQGSEHVIHMEPNRIASFNHTHETVLRPYNLQLKEASIATISSAINTKSNLGTFCNRKLREAAVLAAALPAAAVGVHGRGSLNTVPKDKQKEEADQLKRFNDRTAAQIMAEVLQNTTDSLPTGEEVVIQSAITEGVRPKPGYEAGGNPTIAVGALFGKDPHRRDYGGILPPSVRRLTMGNDVIEGTTKSIKGLHSSLTSLFLTESYAKRHLPDVYVQRWMSGRYFPEFYPREMSLVDAAQIIAEAGGLKDFSELTAFFLDRPRHNPAIEELNKAGITTPLDKDGDLFPSLILGLDCLRYPDGKRLHSMIGEIGGSAEWAVGVLPLIWRGGQALGMLASHSTLTDKQLSAEEMWAERFHYTEEEFMLIQDARFEQKPFFTIEDIIEEPFAGGISAFGAITDNYHFPDLKGASIDSDKSLIHTHTLVINSLGLTEHWALTFECTDGLPKSIDLLASPKATFADLTGEALVQKLGAMLEDDHLRRRLRVFFNNEYYPALILVRDQMVVLQKSLESLIERGALSPVDQEIVNAFRQLVPEWFLDNG